MALVGSAAEKAHLVFAQSPGLGRDIPGLLKASVAILGGRGGGKGDVAQGGGDQVNRLDEALRSRRRRLPAGVVTDRRSPYLVLLVAVAFVSVGSVLVRLAQAPPLAVAFYRVTFATLLIGPLRLVRRPARASASLGPRSRLLLVASGVALALHFATWIASLSYTSIASSVLLVNTAPIFAVVLSRIFLRERVSGAVLGAIALAFVGAALIAVGDWGRSPSSLGGNLLALAGAVTLAAYHVVGRGLRDTLPLDAYVLVGLGHRRRRPWASSSRPSARRSPPIRRGPSWSSSPSASCPPSWATAS